jgi:micrococcal nuclease
MIHAPYELSGYGLLLCLARELLRRLVVISSMKTALLICIMLLSGSLFAQEYRGKAVGIEGGGIFTLLTDSNASIPIQMFGIVCPVKKQPYSQEAEKYTGQMLAARNIKVISKGVHPNGRTLALVIVDADTLNAALLSAGLAWHYKQQDKNSHWAALEREARKAGLGLWADKKPTAPWKWKKKH